jgi:hypothetical protein
VPFITNGDDGSMTAATPPLAGTEMPAAETKSRFLCDFGPQIRLNATAE